MREHSQALILPFIVCFSYPVTNFLLPEYLYRGEQSFFRMMW